MILDFMFDGKTGNDFRLKMCRINSGGEEEKIISQTTFNTFKSANSDAEYFVSCSQESLETQFEVAKFDDCELVEMTKYDVEAIQRWFCRDDGFYPFSYVTDEGNNVVYDAKIDISEIIIAGSTLGLLFKIKTNRPYGYTPQRIIRSINTPSQQFSILNQSSKVGDSYINLKIKCKSNGTYTVIHKFNGKNRSTTIPNCVTGEIITINENGIIKTNSSSHDVADQFNYVFPKISNTLTNNKNTYAVSLPCEIEMNYKEYRKVGL